MKKAKIEAESGTGSNYRDQTFRFQKKKLLLKAQITNLFNKFIPEWKRKLRTN